MKGLQILLFTHGGWGTALKESMKMLLREVKFVSEILLTLEMTMNKFYENVREKPAELNEGSIIMTDILGVTALNTGAKLGYEGYEKSIKVISGLNAPILLEVYPQIKFSGSCDFEIVLKSRKESVIDIADKIANPI